MSLYPEYEVFIDWDGDRGINLGSFSNSVQGWEGAGTVPPDLSVSTVQSIQGETSLLVDWIVYNPFTFGEAGAGFDDGQFGAFQAVDEDEAFKFGTAGQGFNDGVFGEFEDPADFERPYAHVGLTNLRIDKTYDVSLWVYVPTGSPNVRITVESLGSSDWSTLNDEWEELTHSFKARHEERTMRIEIDADPDDDAQKVYIDAVQILGFGEDITTQVRSKGTAVTWDYGRDLERATAPIKTGETSFEVHNMNLRYSPEYDGSPLFGDLKPGRASLLRAKWNGKIYNLFHGYLDDFDTNPETGKESVTFIVPDSLADLNQKNISTEVFRGKRTGELIEAILDEVNWPEHARDIDSGASVIRYWWGEDISALDAIKELVAAEGPPSLIAISGDGDFVFRDRHHRLLRARSLNLQATFRAKGDEPLFSAPMEYSVGWKELINHVEFDVTSIHPNNINTGGEDWFGHLPPVVWEWPDTFALGANQERIFNVETDDAFIAARVPTDQRPGGVQWQDFHCPVGSATAKLSNTSGNAVKITIRSGATGAVVQDLKLRAVPLNTNTRLKVEAADNTSIDDHNGERVHSSSLNWANEHDAAAIADIILGQRGERLPTVTISVNNGTTERVEQILTRKLSDRIEIIEPRTGLEAGDEFFIEAISHEVSEAGKLHKVEFGCEKLPRNLDGVFTFGDPDLGFDDGRFARMGVSDPDKLFVLDESNLDEALLGF